MAVNVINVDSVDDIFVSRLVVVVSFVLRQKSMIKFLDRMKKRTRRISMSKCACVKSGLT